jgi:predicted transcriptional regulator
MTTQQSILKYCLTPRTVAELADYLHFEKSSIYSHLNTLQRSGKIEKRGDGKRRASPAVFVTIRKPPKESKSTDDYENLVIIHAHKPFGLHL